MAASALKARKDRLLLDIWSLLCTSAYFYVLETNLEYLKHSIVYYHSARTAGAMLEADMYCLLGLFWSSFICLGSMSMFWWLDVKPGWEWLADLIALIWIGLGISAIAWMKAWMSKPTFGTGMYGSNVG